MISLHQALCILCHVAVICAALRDHGKGSEAAFANPIRKVVTLLQTLAKKVDKEGEIEKELYDEFICYCKSGAADLHVAISDSNTKVPMVQSDIEESQSVSGNLKQELKFQSADRVAAKSAIAEATALRKKEHAAFAAESTEKQGYVDALATAIPKIEAGMSGTGFLQTRAGAAASAAIRRATSKDESLTDDDRQSVLLFLAGTTEDTSERYVPKGMEIVSILKDMKDTFDKDLASAEKKEKEALAMFEELVFAKSKEVKTFTQAIEKKTARVADLDISVARMKQELTDNEAALLENQKFLNDLDLDCKTKTEEMEDRVKTRGEELVAIHDTIKILNDDQALDLFKKTLPSASFLQVDSRRQEVKQAIEALRNAPKQVGVDLRFLELALMGKKVEFSKVLQMIGDMVAILKQEQLDDGSKKEFCRTQFDVTEDKSKTLMGTIKSFEASIDEKTGTLATLKDELQALKVGVVKLDKMVAQATSQRKRENEELNALMADDSAAKALSFGASRNAVAF
jgi:hypothetical protein